ncbi:membrane protein, partial [Raoultella ornithinolytica]
VLRVLHLPSPFPPSRGGFLLPALVQSIGFSDPSRCARDVPLIPLTTVQLAITGLVGLGISAAVETWDQPFTLPTFGWLLASIVIATSLRFGLQMKGQKYAAVASAAAITVNSGSSTMIIAALWYGEQLPLQKIIGGMLILVA